MADLRPCPVTADHEYHGWAEDAPTAKFGKHVHVCPGVSDAGNEPAESSGTENTDA